jgi:hypothetical protein
MAVSKYRDITQVVPVQPALTPTDNLRAAFDLIALCHRLQPIRPHRGVRRYRMGRSDLEAGPD